MLDDRGPVNREQLIRVIGQVRRRWRRKLVLRGAALVVGIAGATLLASAWGLEVFRFRPPAIVAFRVLMLAVFGTSVWVFCVRPLMRRVTDEQVALYLEEREPSLDAALMSAVEASRGGPPCPPEGDGQPQGVAPTLIDRLVESALERSATVDHGGRVERASTRRFGLAAGAIVTGLVAAIVLGPAYLRQGVKALLIVSRSVEASSPYRIDVQPGNATIPRGADQPVTARLVGFASPRVELLYRKAPGAPLDRLPLLAAKHDGEYEGMLIDLPSSIEYFVESNGVSSPVFTLKVADVPYVKRLDLEYVFPKYTGLEPRTAEDAGDIAAPRGTEMHVRIVPTMKTRGGSLKINDANVVPLTVNPDGTLSGAFTVERTGFYRVELDAPTGEPIAASPQYTIDILNDQAPRVAIVKPGHDSTVTPLQEVFLQARADDDFGLQSLELLVSVNGGPQRTVRLFGGGPARREVVGAHTLYLEELHVKPGDAVSYFARATDNDSVTGRKTATSDMYFLRVGPFEKDFKPAQSNAGGGGMGGAGGEVGALSQQQKQIVVATFNIVRDKDKTPAPKFRESVTLVTLAQAKLREQVEGLVGRMNSRLVQPDPSFKRIGDVLPRAATQMRAAEEQLKALRAGDALPPEQRALNFLQQAEEEYQLQVAMNRGGGGGGGRPGSIAEDLAGLFKLELDKLASQYETIQRAGEQAGDQQIDELMEKLRELARRQEQEAERQRQAAARSGANSGSARANQRELADQTEESARRLERLSRELRRPELSDAAQRMHEAADAMRRAATGQGGAAAEANAAARRLRNVEGGLRRDRAASADREIREAQRRAGELAREQRDIAGEVPRVGAGAARQDRIRGLMQRKEAVQGKAAELEHQLDRNALELRRDEKEAARKLQESADAMRAGRVRDKMRYAGQLLQGGQPEYARTFEEDAAATLESLQKKLSEAASAIGGGRADRKTDTLDRAGHLVRGMESLAERMRERGQQGPRGGRQERQSQRGQSGQQGQGQGDGPRGDPSLAGGRTGGRGGAGDTAGPWGPGGATGSQRQWGGNYPYSPEDIRQFRREIREWTGDAQALRRRLTDEGVNPADLDAILKSFRALDADRVYADAEELQRLQSYVLEGLKRFEFKLRRQLADDGNQPLLSESDEVPDGFRTLVEEYYRALSRSQAQSGVKKKSR